MAKTGFAETEFAETGLGETGLAETGSENRLDEKRAIVWNDLAACTVHKRVTGRACGRSRIRRCAMRGDLMKPIRLLLAVAPLLWVAGCMVVMPEDDWDDFVMEGCGHLKDQTAYNQCYLDGTRSRSFCYDAEGTRICRENPYRTCDRARLGAVPLDPTGLSLDSLGCERKPPSQPDAAAVMDSAEAYVAPES
jgi:hypothetical protein